MSFIFQSAGLTKQAFYQCIARAKVQSDLNIHLVPQIRQIKDQLPGCGARLVYQMLQPAHVGRDKFEKFYFHLGFKSKRKRNFQRTTDSRKTRFVKNLIDQKEVTGVNQVWVSDITYYRIKERFYYLTFVMDKYSREILGYSASKNLKTENTTLPAIKMACFKRPGKSHPIIHSDGGGQYYAASFRNLIKNKLKPSMGRTAYENPHAERINGTIKNDFLLHWGPRNFEELTSLNKKAVDNYNELRPHSSLQGMTPKKFAILSTENQAINKEKKYQKKKDHHYN